MRYEIELSTDHDHLLLNLGGYSVKIPNTEKGMNALFRVLREKHLHKVNCTRYGPRKPFMGSNARPVQSMIDKWLRENKVTRTKKAVDPDLELDFSGLEL